ncbi:signal peptidase II [Adlercreutzia sp. ZJ154]|uniref:signal peptidase II n=1 Tax=Adlercreutzia sp. ZJ154 TaxID=2709790 RepID=UPI00198007B6|nr:signal peptidase II [Adlercreutzia sp. ZJ154]
MCMSSFSLSNNEADKEVSAKRGRNAVIFIVVAALLFIADQLSKTIFNVYTPGQVIAEPIPGVLGLKLIHNTGGAWGIFGGMTQALAIFSFIMCAVIVLYLFVIAPSSSAMMAVGLALVFAGGVGNLIDRIANGYVIDFIQLLFIDFPVFNVADIGVTCGIVVVLVALMIESRSDCRTNGAN